eukprot:COSAG04_NODE_3922_length_2420_cov_1.982766_2_plen_449_part_01
MAKPACHTAVVATLLGLLSAEVRAQEESACRADTYMRWGENACSVCPTGRSTPAASTYGCISCPAGRHAEPASASIGDCACPIDKFASQEGTECTSCPVGRFSEAASTSIDDCGCPADTFASQGATDCTSCPAGRFSEAASTSIEDCTCAANTFPVNERAVVEGCVATDATACASWASDGTAVPCEEAGACTYTIVSAGVEECVATEAAQCAGWTSDGTEASCLAAGACVHTASVTEADLTHGCVSCPSGTIHFQKAFFSIVVSYEYIGCFIDAAMRDLGNPELPRDQRWEDPSHIFYGLSGHVGYEFQPTHTMDEVVGGGGTSICARYCAQLGGYRYFGLQWMDECMCANEYGFYGPREDGRCGDDGLNCGNGVATCGWTNSIYKLHLAHQTEDTCVPCPAGRYDHDNDAGTSCKNCPVGRFSDSIGATECTECPAGSFSGTGSTASA